MKSISRRSLILGGLAAAAAAAIPQLSLMQKRCWHRFASGESLIKVADIAEPNCENFEIEVRYTVKRGGARSSRWFCCVADAAKYTDFLMHPKILCQLSALSVGWV